MSATIFMTGVYAIVALLSTYGFIALAGHALGIKAYQSHPPIVVPAVVMSGIVTFIGLIYVFGIFINLLLL